MTPVWAWFGYDEPNYTYMTDGKQVAVRAGGAQSGARVLRTHNLLTSGDGTPGAQVGLDQRLHRGRHRPARATTGRSSIASSTPTRAEDEAVRRRSASCPKRCRRSPRRTSTTGRPGVNYNDIYTGWTLSAEGLRKWRELVYQLGAARRCSGTAARGRELVVGSLERAGHRLLARHPEEFKKLYDYAADGVKRALPNARDRRTGSDGSERRAHAADPARTSSSTACAARTTRPARPARRSTS